MPLHRLINYGLLGAAALVAAGRGGTPERIVAALLVGATILSPLVQARGILHFRSTEWGVAGIDLALLAGLVGLALFTTRFWPMMVAGLQGTSMLAHPAARLVGHEGHQAYAFTEVAPSYIIPLLLLWATARHLQRVRRYGWDPAWTRELPDAYRRGCNADEL